MSRMILITDLKQKMTMVFSKNYLRPFFLNCHFLRVKFFIDRNFFVEITKEIKGFGVGWCIPHDLSADKADMGGALQTPSGLTGNNLDAVDTVFAALKGFSPRDCVGAKHVGLGGLCLSLHKEQTKTSTENWVSKQSFFVMILTLA